MGYVGNEPSVNFTSFAKQDITGDGGASYTLTHAVANANEIEVFVNNVRQEPTEAYTVSGTALTMTGNVASTDDFYVIYLGKALQTTVPPDGSVTSAKISYPLTTFSSTGIDDNATTTAITIDSSENVGIGRVPDTDQYADLTVLALGNGSTIYAAKTGSPYLDVIDNAFLNSAGNFEYQTSNASSRMEFGSGNITFHNAPSGTAGNTATFTERMRIHDGGKLSINGSTAGASHVTIYFASASYSALASQMTDNGSGAGFLVCRKSDGTTIGQVARNGTADSVQYLTTSDYRLKENVSYDFDATAQLKQLRPCTFTWVNDESSATYQGFLAHEVQDIVPHAVNGTKDAVDEDGNIKAQSIDKSDLVPLLVKTIQELEARITALENS